jgi:alpha-beta hydrolase superfamily lysophospholipase
VNPGVPAANSGNDLEARLTAAVREMVLASSRLTALAGGAAAVDAMLGRIENVWLDHRGIRVHADWHRAESPRATIVFQPGSGAHARVYFRLGGLLAQRGYHVLAIDRPGHGLSEGPRGDCTIDQAIDVAAAALDYARHACELPVVLMGSSMGGLLTIFALLRGVRPDYAIAHNFVYPGKLISMRLRARWIARYRTRPYPLTELVHGFERLSDDPAIARYLQDRADPGFAWELTARSVASLFAFRAAAPPPTIETLVLTGDHDKAIPAWATRFFAWWSGLANYELKVIKPAGHLLFHDHLDQTLPIVTQWLDARVGCADRSGVNW